MKKCKATSKYYVLRRVLKFEERTKQQMPKVSILIPVYDVEQYLPTCLDSVLAQTLHDWEAICVNDGSPDKCGEILEKYAQKDSRIKIITKENQGLSAARNDALNLAEGDYICLLDSDDELAPEFLEQMCDLLDQSGADIALCQTQQGEEQPNWQKTAVNIQSYVHPFDAYMQGQLKTFASIWGKLYTKEIAKGLNFNNEISQGGEDLLYLYQALYQAKRVISTSQTLHFYRKRPNSVMTSKLSERFVSANIKTAELMMNYFKDKELSSKTRQILNQKIAKRIFKFTVLEPKRKDKKNLATWYAKMRPLLADLKKKGIYQPKYLTLKNQFKSWLFLRNIKNA